MDDAKLRELALKVGPLADDNYDAFIAAANPAEILARLDEKERHVHVLDRMLGYLIELRRAQGDILVRPWQEKLEPHCLHVDDLIEELEKELGRPSTVAR